MVTVSVKLYLAALASLEADSTQGVCAHVCALLRYGNSFYRRALKVTI